MFIPFIAFALAFGAKDNGGHTAGLCAGFLNIAIGVLLGILSYSALFALCIILLVKLL